MGNLLGIAGIVILLIVVFILIKNVLEWEKYW
jgi:hypothetical protein